MSVAMGKNGIERLSDIRQGDIRRTGMAREAKMAARLGLLAAATLAWLVGGLHPLTAVDVSAQQALLAGSPAAPGGGAANGIKVHGFWAIDVREPDGTLVTHREFENALRATGAADLIARLAAPTIPVNASPIDQVWRITVDRATSVSGPAPCTPQNSHNGIFLTFGAGDCSVNSTPPRAGRAVMNGTTVQVDSQLISHDAMELTGTLSTEFDSTIGRVRTYWNSPFPHTSRPFTEAILANPIPVVAGQLIQLRVVISLS